MQLHGPTSGSSSTSGDHRQSVSPQSSDCLTAWLHQSSYMVVTVNCLINSFAISAYRIMTGFKRLSKVQNATDLASVSRQHPMQALRARQLKFLGHLIWLENSTCALCQPLHGNARRGRPCTNYIHYIHKLPGHDTWTVGVGAGQGHDKKLARSCDRVVWPTATWLERGRGRERERGRGRGRERERERVYPLQARLMYKISTEIIIMSDL